MSFEALMIHECDIEQEVVDPTTRTISKTKQYDTIKRNFPCRVRPYPGYEVAASMRRSGMVISTAVFFHKNPQVDERHRLVWKDGDGKIHYLYVKRVSNPHEMDVYWKVDTEERTYVAENK